MGTLSVLRKAISIQWVGYRLSRTAFSRFRLLNSDLCLVSSCVGEHENRPPSGGRAHDFGGKNYVAVLRTTSPKVDT